MGDITDAGPRLKAMNDALEIERLRLTDEEREAIKWAASVSEGLCQMGAMNRARTLLGILERLG